VVDLGMAFVDNWVVGKEKVCYWLSKDIVGLVGNLAVQEWQSQHGFLPHPHPLYLPQFSHSSKQDD